jgi:hypothetical protein
MNNHPKYTAKVTIQMHSSVNNSHDGLYEEHLLPTFRHNTEIEAVKAAIDALRVRYYELERFEDE